MTDEAEDKPKPVINYKLITDGFTNPNVRKVESANMRETRDRLRQISLFYMGRPGTEPKAEPTSIKIGTYQRLPFGGFDFEHPIEQWNGKTEDVAMLSAILNEKFPESGAFSRDTAGSLSATIRLLKESSVPDDQLKQLIEALAGNAEAQQLFATSDPAQVLTDSINLARHRAVVEELEHIALDPTSSEGDLQKVLEKDWWIFGGRYVDTSERRSLTVLDEMDVPLIRSDGALHVVELKKANMPNTVVNYRNHLALGVETARAVHQAANYLRALDEQRAQIKAEFGIETRRASATVVMAHTSHVSGRTHDEVEETYRTFSAQMSRIELITYNTLIDGARNALALSE